MAILFFIPFKVKGRAGNISRITQSINSISKNEDVIVWSLFQTDWRMTKEILAIHGSNIYPIQQSLLVKTIDWLFRLTYIFNTVFCNKFGIIRYHHYSNLTFGQNIIKRIIRRHAVSKIFLNYVWSVELFKKLDQKKMVDIHDIHSERFLVVGQRDWVNLSLRYEDYLLKNCDEIISISYNEYLSLKSRNITSKYFPYLPELKYKRSQDNKSRNQILFIGSNNSVNRRAVDNYYANFYPFIENLQYQHVFLGGIAEYIIEKLPKGTYQVKSTFEFKDIIIDEVLFAHNLCGNSTGLKIKTIDYLALGLPVLCTVHAIDEKIHSIFSSRITIYGNEICQSKFIDEFVSWANEQSIADGLEKYRRALSEYSLT